MCVCVGMWGWVCGGVCGCGCVCVGLGSRWVCEGCVHVQNLLNDMNKKWCEGKHSPTINKVYIKEKTVQVAESRKFFKIYVA